MENRFKRLRYSDDFLMHQEISMSQLAEKMQVSKATISKLENDENYDAKVSTIHLYKEIFPDVSYDYLMGGTNTKYTQYSKFADKLPFSDDFYDSIKKIANACKDDYRLEYLIEAIVSNRDSLMVLLYTIFDEYRPIYDYTTMNDVSAGFFSDVNELSDYKTFVLTRAIMAFLEKSVVPKLGIAFKRYIEDVEKYILNHTSNPENIPDNAPLFLQKYIKSSKEACEEFKKYYKDLPEDILGDLPF